MPGHARRHSAVSCAKMAEPVDVPFWLWTRMGRRKHTFNRIRQVAPMCFHGRAHNGRAHWRHVANMIEASVWGCDAALYQITLTTCYYYATVQYYVRTTFAPCGLRGRK